jgi:hypothetical protein
MRERGERRREGDLAGADDDAAEGAVDTPIDKNYETSGKERGGGTEELTVKAIARFGDIHSGRTDGLRRIVGHRIGKSIQERISGSHIPLSGEHGIIQEAPTRLCVHHEEVQVRSVGEEVPLSSIVRARGAGHGEVVEAQSCEGVGFGDLVSLLTCGLCGSHGGGHVRHRQLHRTYLEFGLSDNLLLRSRWG